ncbi:MAG: acetyl-CoA carboxylase biotin carboxyl carrier protein [Firmicutes bacterium]|jgi:acetyl-CoA carboxylase biotin carboxyl carrier protein|nr:acetyl-CoA carboxylase biotin carboxyl carrier protein [Bacillota bacterium]
MNEKTLRQLVDIFENSTLSGLEVQEGQDGWRVRLERTAAEAGDRACIAEHTGTGKLTNAESHSRQIHTEAEENTEPVKAPIVGVFYEGPSPEEPPFVKVGQQVEKGDTLCLIEAMKMMNELKAPVSGIIKGIYVENGSLVEFGQTIYEVQPC